jgi:subtilase family serine protease
LAPKALVILVEAVDNSFANLFAAVSKANALVAAKGGGEVSMSWGGGEFSSETSSDSTFTTANVVYFASAGDSPGTEYPCVSPNVVCAGGTGNSRNPTTGSIQGQVAWEDTGGGISAYEARPVWQNGISTLVGSKRGVPDVAADADPNTGVWVYNSTLSPPSVWWIVGGTSLASPTLAAISNAAGHFYASSLAEHNVIYSTLGTTGAGWSAVTYGFCNLYDGSIATQKWNFCTGVGSPYGFSYKVGVQ